jgi:hypothetical protein
MNESQLSNSQNLRSEDGESVTPGPSMAGGLQQPVPSMSVQSLLNSVANENSTSFESTLYHASEGYSSMGS